MRLLLTILTVLISAQISLSPVSVWSYEAEESLPIGFTEEELLRLNEIGIGHEITSPPPVNIRNPAEWEPSEGVIIRYPLGIPEELVVEMSEALTVYTIVSATYYASAVNTYTSAGVNMDNTEFIIALTNSHWTRDYGPWFIFDGTDQMGIVDHIYNRPRPYDDAIPGIIGAEWAMSVYGLDLIHAGGNHMSDGLGISMSTELVYNENYTKTEQEVDDLMYEYLGNDYTVLPYIEGGGIHHIDCWAKFLNPATILIKDVDPSDASYDLLNERAEFLSQQMSSWGRPFTIVRIYCPGTTAYTNSIILNNKVFVPLFGGSYSSADAAALDLYGDVMPGYEILGFYGSWYSNDAIHCRAMGVPDREMLYIHHLPLYVTDNVNDDYPITAKIVDYSSSGLIDESLAISFSIDGGDYFSVPLYATGENDTYLGHIPAQPYGTDVSYYITAADNSGRDENHPYIGEPGAHHFKVNMAPQIISPDSFLCKASDDFKFYPEIEDIDDESFTIVYPEFPDWAITRNDSLLGTAPEEYAEFGFTVEVSDGYYSDIQNAKILVYLCGDIDSDNLINVLDIVYLINNIYKNGPDPAVPESADVDNSDDINILDIVYLINFLYKGGPDPLCR